jgi:hypothetical protein
MHESGAWRAEQGSVSGDFYFGYLIDVTDNVQGESCFYLQMIPIC